MNTRASPVDTPTPRTDAAQFEVEHATMPGYALAGWKIARTLERETVELANTVLALQTRIESLQSRERRLRDAIEEAVRDGSLDAFKDLSAALSEDAP